MKYKAVLFDLDGTLLDTLTDLTNSVNLTMEECGYPTRTPREIRSFLGNGARILVESAMPPEARDPETVDKTLARYRIHYAKHCREATAPYPGIAQLLEQLHENGVKIAIVSNKPDTATEELAAQYFPETADAAVGASEQVAIKPAPDMVYLALKKLGVSRGEAAFVGDSEVDIATAKAAGMDGIAVTWGFRDEDELIRAGAAALAHDAAELVALLQ